MSTSFNLNSSLMAQTGTQVSKQEVVQTTIQSSFYVVKNDVSSVCALNVPDKLAQLFRSLFATNFGYTLTQMSPKLEYKRRNTLVISYHNAMWNGNNAKMQKIRDLLNSETTKKNSSTNSTTPSIELLNNTFETLDSFITGKMKVKSESSLEDRLLFVMLMYLCTFRTIQPDTTKNPKTVFGYLSDSGLTSAVKPAGKGKKEEYKTLSDTTDKKYKDSVSYKMIQTYLNDWTKQVLSEMPSGQSTEITTQSLIDLLYQSFEHKVKLDSTPNPESFSAVPQMKSILEKVYLS